VADLKIMTTSIKAFKQLSNERALNKAFRNSIAQNRKKFKFKKQQFEIKPK